MTYQEIDNKINLIDKYQDEFDDYLGKILEPFYKKVENKTIEELQNIKTEIYEIVNNIHPKISNYSITKLSLTYLINNKIKRLNYEN